MRRPSLPPPSILSKAVYVSDYFIEEYQNYVFKKDAKGKKKKEFDIFLIDDVNTLQIRIPMYSHVGTLPL